VTGYKRGRSTKTGAGAAELLDAGGEPPVEDPADAARRAREICLRQLAAGPRTRSQLAQVLARKDIPSEIGSEVLDRLEGVRLIDDEAYAEQWVRSRHTSRGLSRRALGQELRTRGVSDEFAAQALDSIDDNAETEKARQLVDSKLRSTRALPVQTRVRRLVGMLARKGYGPGVAIRVVREALALEVELDAADRRMLDSLDGPLSDATRVGD
jgi:regulatory protein